MSRTSGLSGVDEAYVRSGLPGTIGVAAVFTGDPFDLAGLQARVSERWGDLERMRQLLLPPRGPAALASHRWATGEPFDPAFHVTASEQELQPLLTAAVSQRLPTDRPLWQLLLPKSASPREHALVLLAHHALLDGSSLETLLRLLMDDSPLARSGPLARLPEVPRQRARPAALFREFRDNNVLGQSLPVAPGDLRPSVAVARLDPDVMRSARRRPADGRGATLNELLLGAVAGALPACYSTASTSWPQGPVALYATVPVDLRSRHEAQRLGNFITAIRVRLPVGIDSPAGRLHACQRLMAALPHRRRAHTVVLPFVDGLVRAMPWLTTALAKRMVRPDVTTAVCTAFKWRDNPCHLHSRRLTGIVPLPAVSSPGTANLTLVQTADAYMLTVVSHLRPDASRLIADAVAQELTTMATPEPAPAYVRESAP
ncbi:wax ester/triacylglycerol synthase domain-containing protein [Streptomyces sp. NPDC005878]|uniref:wax ester/triacylglycerol synthase domain-containing protein n=1 Tax=Streptomyces sp. NPDC005878 TaxID=3157077 RepID=UPI0033F7E2C3